MKDNSLNSVSRRSALAAASSLPLAGCSERVSNVLSNSEEGSFLGVVDIGSRYDEPLQVEMQVEWEGEVVLDRTYDIETVDDETGAMGGAIVDREWPDEYGKFTVSSRLSGEDWRVADPERYDYPDCFSVRVRINQTGTLEHYIGLQEYYCEEDQIHFEEEDTGLDAN